MKVFLPYRAELGWVIMAHAPQVYACKEPDKVAMIELHREVLYPGCRYICVDMRRDTERRGARTETEQAEVWRQLARYRYGPNVEFVHPATNLRDDTPRERFIPKPMTSTHLGVDVVVCPRKREYGPDKNWRQWQTVVDGLRQEYRIWAAGSPALSFDVEGVVGYGSERLDRDIQAMLEAKLVIATDSGLAHLAILCGQPLLLVTHEGRIAPGGDDVGRKYWPVELWRYEMCNHRDAPIHVVDGWTKPQTVVDEARRLLCE